LGGGGMGGDELGSKRISIRRTSKVCKLWAQWDDPEVQRIP